MKLDEFYKKITTDEGRGEILSSFSKLDEDNSRQADDFFEKYGVGNWHYDRYSVSYEQRDYVARIDAYQDLLDLIKSSDPHKFSKIHKGTPYCFLGWLFMDIGDYEKAVFYIDLAILEDIRIRPSNWREYPSSRLLTLKIIEDKDSPIHKRIVKEISDLLKVEIDNYSIIIQDTKMTSPDKLVKKFVEGGIKNSHHRTIVSSFYSFVLQEKFLLNLIKKKGAESGSIEPFLIHLRKGCIILETIFKEIYSGLSGLTLHNILCDPFVKKDSGFSLQDTGKVGATLEDVVKLLIPYFENADLLPQNKWITIAYRLRNVTSHGLPWSEIIDEELYKKLYQNILFSIFYLVDNRYQET